MTDLAIGVIGAGGMGTQHAMNVHRLAAGARVAGLYDLDQGRAGQVAADCGHAKVFQDPLQLIEDESVDAVVIASPDSTHADYVQACLRCHKPVLCEKPLATTAADALKIVEAEQELDLSLVAVGFMRRFDPQHVAVQQLVAAGAVGRAILFKGVHRNPLASPHLPGSIVVTNSAIHDIDSVRWLLKREITEVYVRGVRTNASFSDETRDMLLIHMVLSGECLATIEVSVAVEYGYEVSAEIVGERGTVETMQPADAAVRSRKLRSVAVPQSHLERFHAAFAVELTNWVHSIQTKRLFTGANAWDGYMSLLVSDSCIESLKSRTSIAVPTPSRPALYRPSAT